MEAYMEDITATPELVKANITVLLTTEEASIMIRKSLEAHNMKSKALKKAKLAMIEHYLGE